MQKKIVIGIIVMSLLSLGFYFLNNNNKKSMYDTSNEFTYENNFGKDTGPIYEAEIEQKKEKGTLRRNINNPIKKIEENKNIVMIDGIPYEKFNGYLMPPEPNEEENNKTLLGIDVNKNFVRDDLERKYVKTSHSKIELGKIMQYARIYQLYLSDEKVLSMSDSLIKMRLSLGTLGDGIRKQVANTPERERMLGGGVGSGLYSVPSPNDFTRYVYRDFSFPKETENKDFSGYEWDIGFYADKPFPLYDEAGGIYELYYEGKTYKDLNDEEFCNVNYGLGDTKECTEKGKEKVKRFDNTPFYNLVKDGTVDKIIEEQNKRLIERNWYE